MGCSQSKIENEEAVARCKERKDHMKNAVSARNGFAAAQTSYTVFLRNTGAALSDFASRESIFPHPHPHLAHSTSAPAYSPILDEPPSYSTLPPPPPPIPAEMADQPPAPLQRAQSMPQLKASKAVPHQSETIVEEEEEEEEEEVESEHSLKRRSNGKRGVGVRAVDEIPPPPTPPPETPPPPVTRTINRASSPPLPGGATWDYFFNVDMPGVSLGDPEDVSRQREEIERKMLEERSKRTEVESSASVVRKMEDLPPKVPEKVVEKPPPPPPQEARPASGGGKIVKRGKQMVPSPATGGAGDVKRAVKVVSLVQKFNELDDHFLAASQEAHEVSKMLEAARLHYHSSFANNCGHINHSERVMKVITWNRSFRNLPNADTGKNDFDSEENETHATVLDKLLAWEKKLYDEVKAGEIMKFDYQKKVAMLRKQKKRHASPETLEKTKAAVSHLHTRYIVDMQSLDSTVSEINRLRDEQLYPKLVALVDGMAKMWNSMQICHRQQAKIAEDLKYVDISECVKETSGDHCQQTEHLCEIVQGWHTEFDKMVSNQKKYIECLNSWLKLNLIPIESSLKDKVSSPPCAPNPPIQRLLIAWHDFLEKLPEDLAKSAIISFAAVLHTIWQNQEDELKMKVKCEEARKDLVRKTRDFEDWYNKHMQRRTPPDNVDPDRPEDFAHDEAVLEREANVEAAKKRLEDEEAAYRKQCIQVREKTLANLRTRMPELFRALFEFAVACSEMYRELQSICQEEHKRRSS